MQIQERVHQYYWDHDYNCATTTLKILAHKFSIPLTEQMLDAVAGIHGAGQSGGQCGLVLGPLLFLGILGKNRAVPASEIAALSGAFARDFSAKFGGLLCSDLRPGGFNADDPPHLCEALSCQAATFAANYLDRNIEEKKRQALGEDRGRPPHHQQA
jgi:hypothetical protein